MDTWTKAAKLLICLGCAEREAECGGWEMEGGSSLPAEVQDAAHTFYVDLKEFIRMQ